MAPIQPFLKKFLIDNFKPLFSSNELGALGNIMTDTQLKNEFGALPKFEVTGEDIRSVGSEKFRLKDFLYENPLPFQMDYSRLRGAQRDPLKDFSMRGQVGAIQQSPTLAKDASMLQGKTIVPLVGDRSSRDVIITGIGDVEFKNPVRTSGGIQFMDDKDQSWASMMSVMKDINKTVETVEQMGGKPVGMTTTMGAEGGDFSLDTANLILETLKAKNLPKTTLNKMTKAIREQVKGGKKPFANIPNLNNMEEFESYFKGLVGSPRGDLVKAFDKAVVQDLGGPKVGQIRIALTNPGLIAEDFLGMGTRFSDIKSGMSKSTHPSYDTKISKAPEAEVFTFGRGIPRTIMLREPMKGVRAEGKGFGTLKGMPADQRKLQMQIPVQPVDQQLVDEASKYLEIQRTLGDKAAYEYAQKLIPAT
tara:strand:+ start:13 stop:1269 length:1257 start_codon:yes stop_codon:yes gene_type:complete